MATLFRPSYYCPTTTEEALFLLDEKPYARIIAGGTDMLVQKPHDVKNLIDITKLGLHYIMSSGMGIRIGACTTINDIENSELLKKNTPILVDTASVFATRQIKNIATIGGNICNAAPCADFSSALIAFDAKAKVVGLNEDRLIPLEDFIIGVGKTVLKKNEILTEFDIPCSPPHTGGCYIKLGRTNVDLAVVSVASRVTLKENGICDDVRLVLAGGVATCPIRVKAAEELLEGSEIKDDLVEKVVQISSEEIKPRRTSIRATSEYKKMVIKVIVKRALEEAVKRAKLGGEIV